MWLFWCYGCRALYIGEGGDLIDATATHHYGEHAGEDGGYFDAWDNSSAIPA